VSESTNNGINIIAFQAAALTQIKNAVNLIVASKAPCVPRIRGPWRKLAESCRSQLEIPEMRSDRRVKTRPGFAPHRF